MSITVDINSAKAALKNVSGAPERVVTTLQEIGDQMISELSRSTPVDSGDLLGSERIEKTQDGVEVIIGDDSSVTYARPVAARTNFVEDAKKAAMANLLERVKKAAKGT